MGTKRAIAPQLASIISDGPDGPLLDLFSGISAVGEAVGTSRELWCNDRQLFARRVAEAFFTFSEPPLNHLDVSEHAAAHYISNVAALERRYSRALEREAQALQSADISTLSSLETEIASVVNSEDLERERASAAITPREFPYRLFSITYAAGYIGIAQAIQVDSIRYAIDQLRETRVLDEEQYHWLSIALCQALSKVATTTGHFAQFLTIKESTSKRYIAQRSRSVWAEWLSALHDFAPIGTKTWRLNNRVFQEDANALLCSLNNTTPKPSIVYADPPYTKDQYSRYYHLYETLLHYDYPSINGAGRYRRDRFTSPFSLKSAVENSFDALIGYTANLGAQLILSYPEMGLFNDALSAIPLMFEKHYGRVCSIVQLDHAHSSMGASKHQKHKAYVKEYVFISERR